MMIVLGLGANTKSSWGAPAQTIRHALHLFGVNGIRIKARSPLYESAPLGVLEQADFVNAVVVGATALPPVALLRVLKRLEKLAGHRDAQRWGPRPLDIDILDYAGRMINWPASKKETLRPESRLRPRYRTPAEQTRGRPLLIVPHPQMHLREFVLQPLGDIMPRWHHPVTGESAAQLLKGLPQDTRGEEGQIRRVVGGPS